MKCPKCGGKTTAYDSLLTPENWRKRYRKCRECNYHFTTFEAAKPKSNNQVVICCGECLMRDRCDIRAENGFTENDFCSYGEKE